MFLNVVNAFHLPTSRTICRIQPIAMAGFGAPKAKKDEVYVQPPVDTGNCACGSGKTYGACCQVAHNDKLSSISPTDQTRARFSAFCYGIVPYIMDSCHPKMKDYVPPETQTERPGRSKRQIWNKSLTQFTNDYEFSNLKFENEETDSKPEGSAVAVVSITLDRQRRGVMSGVEVISEKLKYKKEGDAWLYLSSELTIKGEEIKPGAPRAPAPIPKMVTTNKVGVMKGN